LRSVRPMLGFSASGGPTYNRLHASAYPIPGSKPNASTTSYFCKGYARGIICRRRWYVQELARYYFSSRAYISGEETCRCRHFLQDVKIYGADGCKLVSEIRGGLPDFVLVQTSVMPHKYNKIKNLCLSVQIRVLKTYKSVSSINLLPPMSLTSGHIFRFWNVRWGGRGRAAWPPGNGCHRLDSRPH
jgi:hypothetical protein